MHLFANKLPLGRRLTRRAALCCSVLFLSTLHCVAIGQQIQHPLPPPIPIYINGTYVGDMNLYVDYSGGPNNGAISGTFTPIFGVPNLELTYGFGSINLIQYVSSDPLQPPAALPLLDPPMGSTVGPGAPWSDNRPGYWDEYPPPWYPNAPPPGQPPWDPGYSLGNNLSNNGLNFSDQPHGGPPRTIGFDTVVIGTGNDGSTTIGSGFHWSVGLDGNGNPIPGSVIANPIPGLTPGEISDLNRKHVKFAVPL